MADWNGRWSTPTWREQLELGFNDAAAVDRIREVTRTGRPAGSEALIEGAEARTGRALRPAQRGPKTSAATVESHLNFPRFV
jgi:hypothetical protein